MKPVPIESLTRREIEALWLLEARLSIEEIAVVLFISSEAVERHTRSIYPKLTTGRVPRPVVRAHVATPRAPRRLSPRLRPAAWSPP